MSFIKDGWSTFCSLTRALLTIGGGPADDEAERGSFPLPVRGRPLPEPARFSNRRENDDAADPPLPRPPPRGIDVALRLRLRRGRCKRASSAADAVCVDDATGGACAEEVDEEDEDGGRARPPSLLLVRPKRSGCAVMMPHVSPRPLPPPPRL
jgi:hypothetical protein